MWKFIDGGFNRGKNREASRWVEINRTVSWLWINNTEPYRYCLDKRWFSHCFIFQPPNQAAEFDFGGKMRGSAECPLPENASATDRVQEHQWCPSFWGITVHPHHTPTSVNSNPTKAKGGDSLMCVLLWMTYSGRSVSQNTNRVKD